MVRPCSLAISSEPEKTVCFGFWDDRKVLIREIAKSSGRWMFLIYGRVIVQGLAAWSPFVLWSRLAGSVQQRYSLSRMGHSVVNEYIHI
jgi:hypothetical protein